MSPNRNLKLDTFNSIHKLICVWRITDRFYACLGTANQIYVGRYNLPKMLLAQKHQHIWRHENKIIMMRYLARIRWASLWWVPGSLWWVPGSLWWVPASLWWVPASLWWVPASLWWVPASLWWVPASLWWVPASLWWVPASLWWVPASLWWVPASQ